MSSAVSLERMSHYGNYLIDMATAKEHYDRHLGRIYAWMLGDFNERVEQQLKYFQQQKIVPAQNRIAIDAGCGNGIQSMALAHLGFNVMAVDFNGHLLDELKSHAQGKTVNVIESSITDLPGYAQPAELIICMGDTLPHLESVEQVEYLLKEWLQLLLPGGKLILSFRELAIEQQGEKRFIPVKSDANRILTCFLEFHNDHVLVHDMLYEKQDGQWQFNLSAYKKLRLSRNQVAGLLERAGYRVADVQEIGGMVYMIAERN